MPASKKRRPANIQIEVIRLNEPDEQTILEACLLLLEGDSDERNDAENGPKTHVLPA